MEFTPDQVNALTGNRLKIFCYLLKEHQAVGPRELQHALGIASVSTVSFHLNKMIELELVEKNAANQYQLIQEYDRKTFRFNVMANFFLFNDRFWPRILYISIVAALTLIIAVVLIIFQQQVMAIGLMLITLVFVMISAFIEFYQQQQQLPWND